MLAPLPVGILLQGQTRFHIFALVLIAAFAWSMDRVHARAHRTFVERIRATALLDVSTQELARQHAYLETLLTMAPVAIAVIDRERQIRNVNRQFTALFGYEARDAVGRLLDELIVPEDQRVAAGGPEPPGGHGARLTARDEGRRRHGRSGPVR